MENELASHEPLRHIAVQILEFSFSLSVEAERHGIKLILCDALQKQPESRRKCEACAASHGFRNLGELSTKSSQRGYGAFGCGSKYKACVVLARSSREIAVESITYSFAAHPQTKYGSSSRSESRMIR